ncbi:hypothetical protein AB0N05_37460 [Nocardia sp. NPDC051030]|uniref:hypothetical protein n=1 Tax=Nocardia sp. NPDC051030 TaxID=3155162 RepID=UPI00341CF483
MTTGRPSEASAEPAQAHASGGQQDLSGREAHLAAADVVLAQAAELDDGGRDREPDVSRDHERDHDQAEPGQGSVRQLGDQAGQDQQRDRRRNPGPECRGELIGEVTFVPPDLPCPPGGESSEEKQGADHDPGHRVVSPLCGREMWFSPAGVTGRGVAIMPDDDRDPRAHSHTRCACDIAVRGEDPADLAIELRALAGVVGDQLQALWPTATSRATTS